MLKVNFVRFKERSQRQRAAASLSFEDDFFFHSWKFILCDFSWRANDMPYYYLWKLNLWPFFILLRFVWGELQYQLAVSCDIREQINPSMFELLGKELCILNMYGIFLIFSPTWIKAARSPLNWQKEIYMTEMQRHSLFNCRKKYTWEKSCAHFSQWSNKPIISLQILREHSFLKHCQKKKHVNKLMENCYKATDHDN
jgi:hypothetical protein